MPPERVLGVGDTLRTSIADAAAAGIAACWVVGGIHCDDLRGDSQRAATLARDAGLAPAYVVHRFDW